MPETKIMVIRAAPGIFDNDLSASFKSALPSGVIVSIDSLKDMLINCSVEDSSATALAVLRAIVTSFLNANYSPIAVMGLHSLEAVNNFIAVFQTTAIASISLFVDNETLVRQFRANQNRINYAVLNAGSNEVTRQKWKRSRDTVDSEYAQAVNRHILATREETDLYMDTSCMNTVSIVEALLRAMRDRDFKAP